MKRSRRRSGKVKNLDNKFRITKRRSIHGAFTITDDTETTTVDPVGHLMGKKTTRIFVVNGSDYDELGCHDHVITELYFDEGLGHGVADHNGKAEAYIESVSQLPLWPRTATDDAFTNKSHWDDRTIRKDFSSVSWFDNSWTDHSWDDRSSDTPPCFWTKNSADMTDVHSQQWKKFDAEYPDRGWRVTFDVFTSYDMVLRALVDFLAMHRGKVHVWIQGVLDDMNSTALILRLQQDVKRAFLSYIQVRKYEMSRYWEMDLDQSEDLFAYYAGRPPQRIPTVPWRVSSIGMRTFGNKKPQVFPATTWMGDLKYQDSPMTYDVVDVLKDGAVYANYSGYVNMVPIWKHDKVDFGWKEVGPNEYMMAPLDSDPGPVGYLYKVAHPKFFMGMGSVATSQHSAFGLGRSGPELYAQLTRKLLTDHDTSGHMIASALCFRSHLLWYLEEVYINLRTKKSIYLMSFNEPADTEYHTVEEYRNAIVDMKSLMAESAYPKYAVPHVMICEHFVKLVG